MGKHEGYREPEESAGINTNSICGLKPDTINMSEWFTEGTSDGFMLGATHIPGSYKDFVRMVVPKLHNMGIVQSEYMTTTMRENLGLPRPLR